MGREGRAYYFRYKRKFVGIRSHVKSRWGLRGAGAVINR